MKAVFLDRDGVINEYPGDGDYVKSWKEFRFLAAAKPALQKLAEFGIPVFVISNQAGVGKGVYPRAELDNITNNMLQEVRKAGGDMAGVFYCTHRSEENCSCRKPKAGLIHSAAAEFAKNGGKIVLRESFFVGDTVLDIQAGKCAGLKTIMVFSGKEKPGNEKTWPVAPDFTARDLLEAVEIILAE